MTAVAINTSIPRTMTLAGLDFLGRLARVVPRNGLIVEVGPLFGSSTWVLAKNADPSVRVISIDTWQPQQWIEAVEARFPGCVPFSKTAFEHYTRDCPNVIPVQGFSPAVMRDRAWSEDIDLFFDDATHEDPGFTESLDFYVPKIRPGGIVAGDDFASGWPDIVKGVTRLADQWSTRPEIIGRLWSLVKPPGQAQSPSVYSLAGPYTQYDLSVSVRTGTGEELEFPPGAWAGFLHSYSRLRAIKIDWAQPRSDDLSGAYQVLSRRGHPSAWARFGTWASTRNGAVTAFRGHLLGAGPDLELGYQACCIVRGKRKREHTRNTKAFRDGEWTALGTPQMHEADESPEERTVVGVSALRVYVYSRDKAEDSSSPECRSMSGES